MRVFRRRALGLAIPLFALFSLPARSQNLLFNPGFDRDLSGWGVRTEFYPPANVDASAQWEATDVLGGSSGSVRFRLRGGRQTVNRVQLTQCFPATPGRRYTGGGLVRTDDELQNGVLVSVELFSTAGCSGDPAASSGAGSLLSVGFTHVSSGGIWLPASASVLGGASVQSVRFTTGIYAVTGSYYSSSSFDGLFDDAYLVEQTDPAATWILPAAGRGSGAAGSLWTTTLSLANPGPEGALVTLKFLDHDTEGRTGVEKTFLVRAGTLVEYADVLGNLFGVAQGYGAIRVTSSSASLVVQSETSTPSLGGTVGQALPVLGPPDFAGAAPKSLAPIRENESFRTNLVLANPTEIPVMTHVVLLAADGTAIGSRDVDLPPLGMTQINGVASALGAAPVDAGRLSISTQTPGGAVAAYASVIDNGTNDPRTLLPIDAAILAAPPAAPNALVNPGFDRDLAGWTSATETYPNPTYGDVSATWTSADAAGSAASGGLALRAHAGYHQIANISLSQCVGSPAENRLVSFGAKVRTDEQFGEADVSVGIEFFASSDCSGAALDSGTATSLGLSGYPTKTSNGLWLPAQMMLAAPSGTQSARVGASAKSLGNGYYWSGSVDGAVDDVYATFAPLTLTPSILPSTAWIRGAQGSYWTTVMALVNPGASDAAVTLKWLEHDSDGRNGFGRTYMVRAGQTLTGVEGYFQDPYGTRWGAILVSSSSPSVVLQSQTSSFVQGTGTVGQALPAFGPADFASATPKALAPIRENPFFRTNLVLANPTELPVTAHVTLYAADGTAIGSRDVELLPLGMTQINRVGSALGASSLDAGRIAVSTTTPGGLVAAYASVIDNVTNDPRTILPR